MKNELPRILIADEHPITRWGVRDALAGMAEVISETGDGMETCDVAIQQSPAAIVMGAMLPLRNGIDAAAQILRSRPEIKIIILTGVDDTGQLGRALRAGVSGYVLKSSPISELKAALGTVLRGEMYFCRTIAERVRRNPTLLTKAAVTRTPVDWLTDRQRDVLQLLAEGQTTKAAAGILKVNPKTVEYHRAHLMERLNIFDVPNLVRWALRYKLVAEG